MEVRHPNFFQHTKLSKYWHYENPYCSYVLTSLNVLFPEGEKYFIRSVKKYSKWITDPQLSQEVRVFVGQEAEHMLSTRQFLEAMVDSTRRRTAIFEGFYKTTFKWLERLMSFWPKLNLAVTAAMEQFTANFSEAAFDKKLFSKMPQQVIHFHHWHAAEEIEHKTVAFDVYKAVGGGYFTRFVGYWMATFILFGYYSAGFCFYTLTDWELYRRPYFAVTKYLQSLKIWIPPVLRQIPTALDYMRFNFNPRDVSHPAMAEHFLNTPEFQFYMPNLAQAPRPVRANPVSA